jgi:hypothetical protein
MIYVIFRYILFLVPGLVCIIAGAILWGTADHKLQLSVDQLNAAVLSYNSTDQPLLQHTSFNITVYANFSAEVTEMQGKTNFANPIQQLINEKTIPSFNELYYSFTGQLFSSCPAPLPPFGQIPTGPIAISASFYGNGKISQNFFFHSGEAASEIDSGELPLYTITTQSMSLREDCPNACADEGGYFDEKAWTCTTFNILSSVCLSVVFVDNEWKLNKAG